MEEQKLVARFTPNSLRDKKAVIEINDDARDLLDWIVMTWIFVERRRRDKERKTISA